MKHDKTLKTGTFSQLISLYPSKVSRSLSLSRESDIRKQKAGNYRLVKFSIELSSELAVFASGVPSIFSCRD